MITVVCFKWFDPQGRWNRSFTYGADHVARLRSMVFRNLAAPHEFVCATDNPSDLPQGVRAVPINERLWQARHRYAKLDIFRPDAGAVYGERILAFDLDCVITGPIDPLLEGVGEFKIWGDTAKGTPYNSSLVYLEAGKRAQVYEDFDPIASPREAKASGYIGSDQAWIGHKLGTGEDRWTEVDGVLSYKRDCLRRRSGRLPNFAKVVFFHGEVDPSMAECQRRSPWIERHWK